MADEEEAFSGLHLFSDGDGELILHVFRDGNIIVLKPHEDDRQREEGFYDFDWNPVPDPLEGDEDPGPTDEDGEGVGPDEDDPIEADPDDEADPDEDED